MLLHLLSYTFIGFRVWTASSLSMTIFMVIFIKNTLQSVVLRSGLEMEKSTDSCRRGVQMGVCRLEFRASVCSCTSHISRKQRWRLRYGGLHLHTPTAPVCKKINDVEDAKRILLTYSEESHARARDQQRGWTECWIWTVWRSPFWFGKRSKIKLHVGFPSISTSSFSDLFVSYIL